MEDQNIQFSFDHEQHTLFAQLLTKTMGTPHGLFPTHQEDDNGNVWEFVMPLTSSIAWRLLWEASGGDLTTPAGERMGEEKRSAILPQSQQFVIFSGDRDYLWSLYQNDGRFYVMRADARRYFHLLLRGRFQHQSDANREVYQTLRQLYGV